MSKDKKERLVVYLDNFNELRLLEDKLEKSERCNSKIIESSQCIIDGKEKIRVVLTKGITIGDTTGCRSDLILKKYVNDIIKFQNRSFSRKQIIDALVKADAPVDKIMAILDPTYYQKEAT